MAAAKEGIAPVTGIDEVVITFAMLSGRVIGLTPHLEFLREKTDLQDPEVEAILSDLRRMGDEPVRPVIRARAGSASTSRRALIELPQEVTMAAEGFVDQRTCPHLPGPDLGWLSQQRSRATAAGATDALLRTEPGFTCGSLHGAILAFADEVAFVSTHPRTTPSITLGLVLAQLRADGIEIRERPEGLSRSLVQTNETWTVNAVGGVRRVGSWVEYGSAITAASLPVASPVPSAVEMNARLWAAAESVYPASPSDRRL